MLGRQRVGRRPLLDVICEAVDEVKEQLGSLSLSELTDIVRCCPNDRVDLRVLSLAEGGRRGVSSSGTNAAQSIR